MLDQIKKYTGEINAFQISTSKDLEQFRLNFLSKKGVLSVLFQNFKEVSSEQKKTTGVLLNQLKVAAQDKYDLYKARLSQSEQLFSGDLTLPAEPILPGARHPVWQPVCV